MTTNSKLTLPHLLDAVAIAGVRAYEHLIDEGYHPNVVQSKMDKAVRRGYLDYGGASNRCWLTEKGTVIE